MDQLAQTKDVLSQFITFCDQQNIKPTSSSLNRFFSNIKHPKLIIAPKLKNTSLKLKIKPKSITIPNSNTTQNDYIVFTTNCRNNGFCVQEFKGRPSVFTDYINCPNSKLVVFISKVDCNIVHYKYYHVVFPKQSSDTIIDFEANPEVEERIEYYSGPPVDTHKFTIVHWRFNQQDYLVDYDSQKVYQNNSFVGIRHKIKTTYYIK